MKKIVYIALASSMLLSLNSCEWFNTTILGNPSKAEIAAQEKLKEEARKDSLARVEQAAIAAVQEEQAAATQQQAQLTQRYHVLIGCFKVSSNADKLISKLEAKGLQPTKLQLKNGFTCVSAQSFNNLNEAYNAMTALLRDSDFCPDDVWVYDTNQQLHQ